jgi:hypothetical protein
MDLYYRHFLFSVLTYPSLLGFLSVFAVRTISRQLHEIRKLVRVTEDEARPNVVGQDTEDGETKFWMKQLSRMSNVEAQALKLATLETLSKGLSYELRVAYVLCFTPPVIIIAQRHNSLSL